MSTAEAQSLTIAWANSVSEIAPEDWDACANPEGGVPLDPFTSHRFLSALERSGSVGEGTGWKPMPLLLRHGERLVACAPLYLKSHSRGEYIFDHPWAEAWERAGGEYYPKLQVAVPFTPATGRRFLCRTGWEARGREALLAGLSQIAAQNGMASVHVTFCERAEAEAAPEDWLQRLTTQFHWHNRGYESYEEFLATLSSRKRKALRKERFAAQGFGGDIEVLTGDALCPEHWDAFWEFYQDTGARKWGTPYLTRAFFDEVRAHMRDDVVLVLARHAGRYVAGALNFLGRDALFGRYWGAIEDHPFLHFELCYHQAIDVAIARGLSRVEAGAQGEHKLARGYLPVDIHSLHYLPDQNFRRAVADYLAREREATREEIDILTGYGPYRASTEEQHD